jgi:four helix bundle protein
MLNQPDNLPTHHFGHERLDVYRLAKEIATWFDQAPIPRGRANLKDQGARAIDSVLLNIGEGAGKTGDARKYHYGVALGSAAEMCVVLDRLPMPGAPDQQVKLRRVGAMLSRMAR